MHDYDEYEMREAEMEQVIDPESEKDIEDWDGDDRLYTPEDEQEQDEYAFSTYEA